MKFCGSTVFLMKFHNFDKKAKIYTVKVRLNFYFAQYFDLSVTYFSLVSFTVFASIKVLALIWFLFKILLSTY